jgi:hypothetical protein
VSHPLIEEEPRQGPDKTVWADAKKASRPFRDRRAGRRPKRMSDLLYLAAVIISFGALSMLVRLCNAIVERDHSEPS